LIQTIVSLAHNMGLCVVVEGGETERQLDLLRLTGCDMVQGHLYGEPLDVASIEKMLNQADRPLV